MRGRKGGERKREGEGKQTRVRNILILSFTLYFISLLTVPHIKQEPLVPDNMYIRRSLSHHTSPLNRTLN